MRIVFVGASDATLQATKQLLEKGYEVIMIEEDEKKVESLKEELDCGIIHGDGSNPEILQEANPKSSDLLFALTDSDQDNILIGLVGQSLKFKTIVVGIRNTSYEKIGLELGLENIIVPSRTIGNNLVNFVENEDAPDLKEYFKSDARLFKTVLEKECPDTVRAIGLPDNAQVICYYRDGTFKLVDDNTKLQEHDEIIILTKKKEIPELEKKFLEKPQN